MDKSNLERLLINLHYVLKEIYGPSAGRWLKYASYHLLPFLDQGHPLVLHPRINHIILDHVQKHGTLSGHLRQLQAVHDELWGPMGIDWNWITLHHGEVFRGTPERCLVALYQTTLKEHE